MPPLKKPSDLKTLCLENLMRHMDRYWLNEFGPVRRTLNNDNGAFLYFIGPFEVLSDQNVDYIFRTMYQANTFSRFSLLLCAHYYLKHLDLSYIKKKFILTDDVCHFIGNNCINLIELNMSGHLDLSAKSLCALLSRMHHLRRLNLSFTRANKQVSDVIVATCKRLEYLYYESCQFIHDACLEDLCADAELRLSIKYLNVDNVFITRETLEKCLLACPNLRLFQCDGMLENLTDLYQVHLNPDLDSEELVVERAKKREIILSGFQIDTFYTEPGKLLKQENMEALSLLCPNLKCLTINSIGTRTILDYLNNFSHLSELVVANSYASFSFQFGGSLSSLLRTRIGAQLKSLHLISIVDVNLRSVAKWCRNLVKLNVEFNGYYEPAIDRTSLVETEFDSAMIMVMPVKSLCSVTITNINMKFEQINLNVEQLMADLRLLLSGCGVRQLKLGGLNELDDAYFAELFEPGLFVDESIEVLEFNELNKITVELLVDLVSRKRNALRELNLIGCKEIGKADVVRLKNLVNAKRFDCKITYT